jgi:ribosome recycling factor
MSADEVLKNAEAKMAKAIEVVKEDLAGIRTGRASAGLVSNVRVDYHGVPMPLNQISSISVPEARLLVIQPWERDMLPSIEKAILRSDLGINPTNDGSVVRLAIPQLTEERRSEMVKMVRRRVEEGKVAVRNVRRDGVEKLRHLKDSKELSEDEQKRMMNRLQQITDGCTGEIDRVAEGKEAELMEI